MPEEPAIVEVKADDSYWSEMLQKQIYSYRCPQCGKWGYVTQPGDVVECSCGVFVRVLSNEPAD